MAAAHSLVPDFLPEYVGCYPAAQQADHASAPANTVPLLVLDMYEHAFAMDYGSAAARYIDAYFANIQWDAASRRLQAV